MIKVLTLMRNSPVCLNTAGCLPINVLRRVVFPAPDGPIIAVTQPGATRALTDCKIGFPFGKMSPSLSKVKSSEKIRPRARVKPRTKN